MLGFFKNGIRSDNMMHVHVVAAEIPPLLPDSYMCSYGYCNALLRAGKLDRVSKHRKEEKYFTGYQRLSPLMNKLQNPFQKYVVSC